MAIIGITNSDGSIAQYPTEYVNGQPFERGDRPAPGATTVFVGDGDRYFVYLPPTVRGINSTMAARVEAAILEHEATATPKSGRRRVKPAIDSAPVQPDTEGDEGGESDEI